nr:hypothetical protein [Tanacetum cinerariifolium]
MVAASKVPMLKPGNTNGAVNTTQAVNTTHGVSTASTQVNDAYSTNIDNLSNVVICSYFISQPNSPQLVHKDLEQIYPNDIKEMDLRWQMTMLTMRARRFLKKTRRKLTINDTENLGFDKSNVECYNCHKRGRFTRQYRALRNQENKHKESLRRSMHVETSTSTTLVSCDVPPPYIGNFMPLIADLSFTGLDEFVNELVVENFKPKSSEEEPKIVVANSTTEAEYVVASNEFVNELVVENFKAKSSEEEPKDQGVINSGCSRHVTGNMSYLTDYKEIDRGYIAFGWNLKGGKITRKEVKTTSTSMETQKPLLKDEDGEEVDVHMY